MPRRSRWLAYALCIQAGQTGAQKNITLAATAAASCKAFQHSGCTLVNTPLGLLAPADLRKQ